MSKYTQDYLAKLQDEILRTMSNGPAFVLADGTQIEGATESEVKAHLTSRLNYVLGRLHTFPGLSNNFEFQDAIEAAGFKIVQARTLRRNQPCSVVTL